MKKDFLVSIVIPVYNVERYLPQCITSIRRQTYTNIEIIFIDDGSTDKSGEIIDTYSLKDKRIKVIHKKNQGVSSARNIGIQNSEGQYICFVDADDYIKDNYVQYLLTLILKYDADISLTNHMSTTFYKRKRPNRNMEKMVSGIDAAISILCYNMPIGVYCKMFKRSLLSKGIRFEEDLFIGEGFNFNFDAFQEADKVAIGNQSIYFYRRDNENSAMTRFKIKTVLCALYAIDRINQKIKKRTQVLVYAVKFAKWHTHADMLSFIISAHKQKKYNDIYLKCLKIARNDALIALKVPTNLKEKFRALLTFVYPKTIPIISMIRDYLYKIKK